MDRTPPGQVQGAGDDVDPVGDPDASNLKPGDEDWTTDISIKTLE